MIGWKRIVVTVGEKIGKEHLTYAQGASAEIVAMATIGAADMYGMPVAPRTCFPPALQARCWPTRAGCSGHHSQYCAGVGVHAAAAALLAGGLFWVFRSLV